MTPENQFVVESSDRLDRFIATLFPQQSRSKLSTLIDSGSVLVDGVARKRSFALKPGMVVEVNGEVETPLHNLEPVSIPIETVFEDEHLLVVNKPRGLATHPAPGLREPTLVNALLGRQSTLSSGSAEFRPGIVHRLDKETTGLLMIAKTDVVHHQLAQQIQDRSAGRRYLGVAGGEIPSPKWRIEAGIKRDSQDRRKMMVDPAGKPAVTEVKRLQVLGGQTLFAAKLESGRTHQIRVHLMAAGYPLVGDTIYGKSPFKDGPLQLHAGWLSFKHPAREERMEFFLAPPIDFTWPECDFESALTVWD